MKMNYSMHLATLIFAVFLLINGCEQESLQYGELCGSHSDCIGGICLSQPGGSICSQNCDSKPCPGGDTCMDFGKQKVCLPNTQMDAGCNSSTTALKCKNGSMYLVDGCGAIIKTIRECPIGCLDSKSCKPCALSNCTWSSFTYSCATSQKMVEYKYCQGSSKLAKMTVTFTNGTSVVCYYPCPGEGSQGKCKDDASGSSCTFF